MPARLRALLHAVLLAFWTGYPRYVNTYVSSINEVGLIEPLSVIQPDRKKSEYLVLDGHLRGLALKELGMSVGPCLLARDDETFSYNYHINRLSTIAEHYMIRRAIDRGVSKERLPRAFNVNLSSINRRINLLEGICPEAIELLQDKQFTRDVTRILRNMKAARQVEAVELMIASNTITVAHAEALLKATPPEQRTDVKPTEREKKAAPIEQIEKLEKDNEPGAGEVPGGRIQLRVRPAQPGGGQGLRHQAAGQ
jgi:ParB-like chromosome segregation protein Spo0J